MTRKIEMLIWKYIFCEENYKHKKFPGLHYLIKKTSYTCQLIYDPNDIPCSKTDHGDTLSPVKCQNVKSTNEW